MRLVIRTRLGETSRTRSLLLRTVVFPELVRTPWIAAVWLEDICELENKIMA